MKLFHNAVEVATTTVAGVGKINNPDNILGAIANSIDSVAIATPLYGAMSGIKIWSYNINNKQITDEYNNGLV